MYLRLTILGKGKVLFTLEEAMKVQSGSRNISVLFFFNLNTTWGWVVKATLPPGRTQYLLYRRLGVPGQECNISAPLGFDA
jgi:hypothetical protein